MPTTTNTRNRPRAVTGFLLETFERLHRSGVIAAEQRAGSESYAELEEVASRLLQSIPGEG